MSSSNDLANAARHLQHTFQGTASGPTLLDSDLVQISRRTIGLLAAPLLPQVGITKDTKEPVMLLDNCCGVGVVRQEIEKVLSEDVLAKSSFLCGDLSGALVDITKQRIEVEGWVNTEARVLDAMNSGLPADSFTHITVALGLHITPDPTAILNDAKRMLKPGGVFGSTTFHSDNGNLFWVPDVRDAFASFPFEAPFPDRMPMQMHKSGEWTSASWVDAHMREQGFRDVDVREVTGKVGVEGAEDFVRSFAVMLPWVMNSWWSEETRAAHPLEEVKGLLTEFLRKKYEGRGWELPFKMVVASGRV